MESSTPPNSEPTQAQRNQARARARAQLTGPGGPFELTTEVVRGHELPVFSNRHRSIRDMVAEAAKFGDAPYLTLGDSTVSFDAFVGRVAAVAAGLTQHHGVTKGDRVAIFAANRPEWAVTFFATVSLGAIAVALNGWWVADEVTYALEKTEPKLLIGDAKRLGRLAGSGTDMPLIDMPLIDMPLIDMDSPEFATLWDFPTAVLPTTSIAEDDPALILFTSGTTGRSKGALISHRAVVGFPQSVKCGGAERSLADRALSGAEAPPAAPPDVTLGNTPLFHVSGLYGHAVINLTTGGSIIYYDGRFEPEKILRLIEQHRITAISPSGSMGPRLVNHPDFGSYDTSSIKRVGLGGAPTSPSLQEAYRQAFPQAGQTLGGGYGSSESTAVMTSIGGQEFLTRPNCAGKPHADVGLEIRGPGGAALPPGTDGQIWVRSAYTTLGYWDDPQATAKAIDANGWLNMGDIGQVDVDGYLTINSRARDMIIRSAENIYPVEIQHRLDAHPSVMESAVVGVDHPEHGQEVKAVVVTAGSVTTGELHDWCAAALAPFKVPAHWELRAEPLPRNAAGKLVKTDL